MKRLTKSKALYLILNFGRDEERALIRDGKTHEAYQIEHARAVLLHALNKSIKEAGRTLEAMVYYTIAGGDWSYNAGLFVHDDDTREMLLELRKHFIDD
jgi:hypothetical protein